jgi:hypothetical protein
MEKFLRIPVTNEQTQLVSATDIVLIEQQSATTVQIHYKSTTATDVVTITHATRGSQDESMRDAIQNAVIASLEEGWTKVAYDVVGLPFPVSGITIA